MAKHVLWGRTMVLKVNHRTKYWWLLLVVLVLLKIGCSLLRVHPWRRKNWLEFLRLVRSDHGLRHSDICAAILQFVLADCSETHLFIEWALLLVLLTAHVIVAAPGLMLVQHCLVLLVITNSDGIECVIQVLTDSYWSSGFQIVMHLKSAVTCCFLIRVIQLSAAT